MDLKIKCLDFSKSVCWKPENDDQPYYRVLESTGQRTFSIFTDKSISIQLHHFQINYKTIKD